MEEVRSRESEAPEGLTVVAERQTAGQGRAGRAWLGTPGGSLLFSTLLRPECLPQRFQLFPVVSGLAVVVALETMYGIRAEVKWPNDVLVNGRKLAGILVTSRVNRGSISKAVIGVGINLTRAPLEVADRAIAVADVIDTPVDRDRLLEEVLSNLGVVYGSVLDEDVDWLQELWQERAAWLGERVLVRTRQESIPGMLDGISRAGALRLATTDGPILEVTSGDIEQGPRPDAELGDN